MAITIGNYIADLRAEKGISQRELAEWSGVSNTEISRIESGKRQNPAPATLKAVSKALSAEYTDLMELAGYIEEIHDDDQFYELVFKDGDGRIVDVKRGVKEMFRRDEDWANVAYRVSHELTNGDRKTLTEMAKIYLDSKRSQNKQA
jgi:transcriptional regulator with XRE-family HTH domain